MNKLVSLLVRLQDKAAHIFGMIYWRRVFTSFKAMFLTFKAMFF